MLILVGVTINFALNGGIIQKAKQASIQTEIAMIQEQLMLKKAEILADNMGSIPSTGYGLSSISDLDGLSQEIISKYNSKLTISSDGTLYYLEENITGEEKVYFENAGITASGASGGQEQSTQSDIEYYSVTFTEGGTEYEIVIVANYADNTLKMYNGLVNGNLTLQDTIKNIIFDSTPFTILLDDVETTITNGKAIYSDNDLVMFIQNGKIYECYSQENGLPKFDSSQCANLVPNFDTSRLVDNSETITYKAYGPSNATFSMIMIVSSNDKVYYVNGDTVMDGATYGYILETYTPSQLNKTFTSNPEDISYSANGSLISLDSSTTYKFIMSNNSPICVYDSSTDAWYGSASNSTYIAFIDDTDNGFVASLNTSTDISGYIAQIEALNNGN